MRVKTRSRGMVNKNQGSKWITRERRLAIYIRDQFTCLICEADLREEPAHNVTLDHIVPRSKGGTNKSDNLYTCCGKCNSSRGDRPIRKWATRGAISRILIQSTRPLNMDLSRAILGNAKREAEAAETGSAYAKACAAARAHSGV